MTEHANVDPRFLAALHAAGGDAAISRFLDRLVPDPLDKLVGTYHVVIDTGLGRYKLACATRALAEEYVERQSADPPNEAIIYEWRRRAVDGKPYLHRIARWWYGERLV